LIDYSLSRWERDRVRVSGEQKTNLFFASFTLTPALSQMEREKKDD
jgi:hypothetical protein